MISRASLCALYVQWPDKPPRDSGALAITSVCQKRIVVNASETIERDLTMQPSDKRTVEFDRAARLKLRAATDMFGTTSLDAMAQKAFTPTH
jgi:hypothetical protein